jgi:hypothetical protein
MSKVVAKQMKRKGGGDHDENKGRGAREENRT